MLKKPPRPSKPVLPPARSNQFKVGIGNGKTSSSNGTKTASFVYVPRQVFITDSKLPNTTTPLVNYVHKATKKKSKIASVEKRDSDEQQHGSENSTAGTNWSPLMDGIMSINPPTFVTGYSKLSNGQTPKDHSKKENDGKMANNLVYDQHMIENVLYGHSKSSLPCFQILCRE